MESSLTRLSLSLIILLSVERQKWQRFFLGLGEIVATPCSHCHLARTARKVRGLVIISKLRKGFYSIAGSKMFAMQPNFCTISMSETSSTTNRNSPVVPDIAVAPFDVHSLCSCSVVLKDSGSPTMSTSKQNSEPLFKIYISNSPLYPLTSIRCQNFSSTSNLQSRFVLWSSQTPYTPSPTPHTSDYTQK